VRNRQQIKTIEEKKRDSERKIEKKQEKGGK
jgi:hypothetical protein